MTRTFERRSPATGEVVGEYPEGDAGDVERAVAVARKVFDEGKWSSAPVALHGKFEQELRAEGGKP